MLNAPLTHEDARIYYLKVPMKPERNDGCSVSLNAPPRTGAPGYEVSSVRKALDLLTAFTVDNPEWTLSSLGRRFGIPKSTAHNLLRTLQSFDLICQDSEQHAYRLGPRALELGLVYGQSSNMLAQARPILRDLAGLTQETVKLGILSKDEVLVIGAVESAHQLHTRGDIGTRWPLHSTSLGKAILSALAHEEAEELVKRRGTVKFTPATLSWEELSEELQRIRSRKYATDLEENERGVRCVAAPVIDRLRGAVAAISVSGPRVRLEDDRLGGLGKQVVAAAKRLESYSCLGGI